MSSSTQPPIVAPSIRALDRLAEQIVPWLRPLLGAGDDLRLSDLAYPRGAGMSHETILFDAEWSGEDGPRKRGLVVRIAPSGPPVYLDAQFEAQCALMRLMRASGRVRVAEILGVETSPDLLGSPFFVMEKVHGRTAVSFPPYAQEGWLFDATPAQRARLWEDSVRQLAAIQRVPASEAAFLDPEGAFPVGFDQEIDRWRRFRDWVDPENALHLLRDALERLVANPPANRPEGIVWGDARLGNMIVADDFTVAAVVDWEQPSLGGALHDLGWWLVSEEGQTVGRGLPELDGMGSRRDTIALWSEASGKPADGIEWYEAFALFKMECLSVRMNRFMSGTGGRGFGREPGQAVAARLDRSGLG